MNYAEYIRRNNVLISDIFNVDGYIVYHLNDNASLFTNSTGEIQFAIAGSNLRKEMILDKKYFDSISDGE